jgi:hypothetical protein
MKVYQMGGTPTDYNYIIGIDPGVKTSGLCFTNKKKGTVSLVTIEDDIFTNVPFPELYVLCNGMVQQYLALIKQNFPRVKPENIAVITEYTWLQGAFSSGLMVLLSTLVNTLLYEGYGSVSMVSNKIAGYFLMTNKKLNQKLIDKWVEFYFPELLEQADSPHCIDALMFSVFLNYEWFLANFHQAERVRRPEYNIITLSE